MQMKDFEKFGYISLFSFKNPAVSCTKDVIHDNDYLEARNIWKTFFSQEEAHTFLFEANTGLVRISNRDGSVEQSNILGQFLALKGKGGEAFSRFFSDNGYLLPVPKNEALEFFPDQLDLLISRLESVINLLNLLSSPGPKNYEKISDEIDHLIFILPPLSLIEEKHLIFLPAGQKIRNLLMDYGSIPEKDFREEIFKKGTISIHDIGYGTYELDSNYYEELIGNEDASDLLKAIMYLYVNFNSSDETTRTFIDYLFHRKILKDIDSHSPESMKKLVLTVAKKAVKDEIDANVAGVKASYDTIKMKPTWTADSLLAAMYFSLFYLNSSLEIYKKCEYCGSFFKVSRSCEKRIYCSDACRNRAAQARHRIRKKAFQME